MEWVVSGCWAYRGVVINQHTLRTACIHTYIHSHFLAHPFIVCHVSYPTQGNATMELRGSAGGDKHHNSRLRDGQDKKNAGRDATTVNICGMLWLSGIFA